jgi:hypothetical protein
VRAALVPAILAALGGCSVPALLPESAGETASVADRGPPADVALSELQANDLGEVTGSVPAPSAPSAEALRDTALGSTTGPTTTLSTSQSVVVTLPPSVPGVPGGVPSTLPPPPSLPPSPPSVSPRRGRIHAGTQPERLGRASINL